MQKISKALGSSAKTTMLKTASTYTKCYTEMYNFLREKSIEADFDIRITNSRQSPDTTIINIVTGDPGFSSYLMMLRPEISTKFKNCLGCELLVKIKN